MTFCFVNKQRKDKLTNHYFTEKSRILPISVTVHVHTMKSGNSYVDVVIPKKTFGSQGSLHQETSSQAGHDGSSLGSSPGEWVPSPGSSWGNTSGLNTPQMAGTVLPPQSHASVSVSASMSPPGSRYVVQEVYSILLHLVGKVIVSLAHSVYSI